MKRNVVSFFFVLRPAVGKGECNVREGFHDVDATTGDPVLTPFCQFGHHHRQDHAYHRKDARHAGVSKEHDAEEKHEHTTAEHGVQFYIAWKVPF